MLSLKCRCITEVPSNTTKRLHWPWNQVYWWIVLVWAVIMSACHWSLILLMLTIKPLRDVNAESCWWWCCWVMLAMVMWDAESCRRRCCQGDLAVAWCRCRVTLATALSSPAGDGAGLTWLWHDVDAESCWRQCYWFMLAMVMWDAESCWRWCCRVMLAMVLPRWLSRNAM
jgi:hypothetical protein